MVFGYFWASACLALFIAFLALDIMGLFSRKNYLDVDGKVWHLYEMETDGYELTLDCRLSC